VDELGVDHLDLNFGCPAAKVTRNGGGAALPVRRRLLADIISATVEAAGAVPVTVKFRKGTDDDHLTYLDTGRIAAEAGCAAIALHARTAEEHYAGHADWEAIATLKAAVTSIPVLGNGDVWEAGDALAMMASTGCDGVVIGRGCLGRPWLFRDLAAAFAGLPVPGPPGLVEQTGFIRRHAHLLVEDQGFDDLRHFRRHAAWYLKGYALGGAARRAITSVSTLAELDTTLDALVDAHGDVTLPDDARRTPRGHTSGPHPVRLPDGWYDLVDDPTPPVGADIEVSGG
ncbi:MAG TPA: tRNA-dihydrouridine synthase, partial [Acidimicrobiales bacterium]|nr:tRNA-dihydrouridine synthase [Acidimicrobiales bacterium]